MVRNIVERMLSESDIYQLIDFLNQDGKNEERIYYTNSIENTTTFTEIGLRKGFFDYSMFCYGAFEDNILTSVLILNLPTPMSKQKSANLTFISLDTGINKTIMLSNCIKVFSCNYGDITKLKICVVPSSGNESLVEFLQEMNFVKELELIDEFGEGINVQVFSYFINC